MTFLMLRLATKFVPHLPAFETAYQAGFRNVELWLGPKILADVTNVARLALHYPNRYVVHFPNRLDLTPEMLDQTVDLYRSLGCGCMVIHQPMHDRYAEDLLGREPALRLAVENHKLTLDGLAAWAVRNSGLTLDVEHVWKYTLCDGPVQQLLDWVQQFLTRHAAKLHHVHLPGYWPGFDEHRPMYCARDLVFPVLSMLTDIQFHGLIVSEVNPEFQNDHELRMDVLLFDAWRRQRETPFHAPVN
jgi:sugar phosphate isomerase/epimerase